MNRRCVLASVAVVVFINSGCGSASPAESLKATLLAANAGNYSDANAGLSTQIRDAVEKAAPLQLIWDGVTKKGQIAGIDTRKEEVRGEGATVTYTIRFKDGTVREGEDQLIKEGGRWKLSSGAFFIRVRTGDPVGKPPPATRPDIP